MDFLFAPALFGLNVLFWTVAVIGFLIITAYSSAERFARSILLLTVFGIALLYIAGIGFSGLWTAITQYPGTVALYFAYFIAIGIAYGTLRWMRKVYKVRKKLIAYRTKHNITGPMKSDERSDFLGSIGERHSQQIPLRVRDNKARIIYWMMFWPVSLPISLKPITRLFEYLYAQIAGALQRISDKAFKDIA